MIDISVRLAIRKTQAALPPMQRARFVWDDENIDWGYKCRTQHSSWSFAIDNPPAVLRYYPDMREGSGDYRVNLESPVNWKPFVIALNGGDVRKFDFWTGSGRAQFNGTGWAQFAYVGMSGNTVQVLDVIGDWVKFKTLKQTDLDAGMTRAKDPDFIHGFHTVTWDRTTKTTKHIWSTSTPRGEVFYPLVTREGVAYIPKRHVVML